MKSIRILIKIALCISMVISFQLMTNYLINLRPDMDGFLISNMTARFFLGDNDWTYESIYNGFVRSALVSLLLFLVNMGLDVATLYKMKKA